MYLVMFKEILKEALNDIKETKCHTQTNGKTENEKQHFPTEAVVIIFTFFFFL